MRLIVIAHNIRSCHNLGSILRSSDAFGVETVYCSGYTPYPLQPDDKRLPHTGTKLTSQIAKTALGAEKTVDCQSIEDINELLENLKMAGFLIVGLEQDPRSRPLKDFKPGLKVVLIIGEEVNGISAELRNYCDNILEIPMKGKKESLNVSVATGIALYQLAG